MSLARGVIGVAGWVLLAMTVVSGGLGLWLVRATHAFAGDALRVEGRVLGQRESPQPGGQAFYTPRVAFVAADGTRHEFAGQLSSGTPRFATGERVPVIYRRTDPHGARIDRFVDNWLGPSVALGLALATACAGLLLVRSSRGGPQ